MNWGHGITIGIISFMIFILSMVSQTFRNNAELVSSDYYQKEIEYQQRIEAIRNSKEIDSLVILSTNEQSILITIPEGFQEKGSIHFIKPNDSKKDFIYSFKNDENLFSFDKVDLSKGVYYIEIELFKSNKSYYIEKQIYL